ncbi:MAG: caspase family protein, partial [Rhodospirillales bacterium]
LRKIDFLPGTESVLVAAARGTAAAEKPSAPAATPQVTKVEPAKRPAEAAAARKQADEARKAREGEIAQLKQEAEQVFKAREADMAKRLKEADAARKAREVEIAKLKQEADQALKAREAEIAKLKQSLAESRDDMTGAADDAGPSFSGIDFGRYHALVIGIDNYKQLPKLKTAVNDARAIAEVLEKDYGFTVTLLLEPTRNDIVDALDAYREKLGRNDNLLIYYAGHGWLDKEVDRGYWLPVDAEPKRRRDWVSNATITDTLKALSAKHVMVVADSCYSGTLVRSADVGARTRTGDYWKQMASKVARVAITSGGLEPVADAGGGGHSPFAKAFIAALGENASVMDGTQLFSQMRRPVMVNARQTPQYADVREAGHDGGDFLFVRKK